MKRLWFFLYVMLMTIPALRSQEFLLHDETFTWTEDADACGGFHYWYDHGNAPTMNWTSPYDYQNGLFYFRFEIIDQPSNAEFQLNFCIWTEYDGSANWRESCATFSDVLAGPGSSSSFSGPVVPALNGGIDWTDLTKLWRFGNPLWVNGHNMGNGPYCTDNPEEWANHELYFPLTLRVTIVAVASGHSFSGWQNYTGGCTPGTQPTPTYSIDYAYERTNESVPSTDEYSSNSVMTGAVDGTGQKLILTPGQDVYFRTKASGCLSASAIQHLIVPLRPVAPSISIDYGNEMTVESIGSTLEYSTSSSYTNPVTGTGNKISLTPGQDLYFWVKATISSFYSLVTHLAVPDRPASPAYTINYTNERTTENIPATVEYSSASNMNGALAGTGSTLALIPGTDYYFRVKYTLSSFASAIFHLPVAQRPVITTAAGDTVHDAFNASVDFHKEVTGFEASDIEVTNAQVTLTGALTVHVDPVSNGDVTVKVIANAVTAGNFASDVFKTYYKELASLISDNTDANAPMLVYPSPVGDILHVEIPKRLTLPVDIKLMNSSGAIVIHKKLVVAESTLELNNIPPGLYILKAIDVTGNVISGKVIKR